MRRPTHADRPALRSRPREASRRWPQVNEERLPVWIDNGRPLFCGIPGSDGRAFKLADDSRGPALDPGGGERATEAVLGLRAPHPFFALARFAPARATGA